MSETAKGQGSALPVDAAAGPAVPPHMELAFAAREAAQADERLSRAQNKLDKTRRQVEDMITTAEENLSAAEDEAGKATAALRELAEQHGATGDEILAGLKAASDQAQAEYERAAMLLAGED